jgi:hypothetical protein
VNLRFGSSGRNLKIVAGSFCVQITEYAYADTWEQLAVRNGDDFHRFSSWVHQTRQSTPGTAGAGRCSQEQRKHLPVADFSRLRTTGRAQNTAGYLQNTPFPGALKYVGSLQRKDGFSEWHSLYREILPPHQRSAQIRRCHMEKHLAIANYVCVVGLYSSAHLIVSRVLGKHLFVHSHHSGELQNRRRRPCRISPTG